MSVIRGILLYIILVKSGQKQLLRGVTMKRLPLCILAYLLQFRKINNMKCDGDTKWTDKLQPAVLSVNTQTKKSTSCTPFTLSLEEI